MQHRTIHWFRKGLRLHDNPALLHAVTSSEVRVVGACFNKMGAVASVKIDQLQNLLILVLL